MLPLLTAASPPAPAGGSTPPEKKGKVELDLDGAPFLEPDEPEEKPDPKQAEPDQPALAAGPAPKKKSKKKLVLFIGLPLILLLAGVVWFVFFGKEPEPDPNIKVVVVPSQPIVQPPKPLALHTLSWPAFWVELADQEGEPRFLNCRLTILANADATALELNSKKIILRDAIYYYINNKEFSFLADMKNLEKIKTDITDVINDYLMSEKVSEVLLETYLIK